MFNRVLHIIAAALFALIAQSAFAGTTYYVNSQAGNDNNNGRSPAQAWRTLGPVNQNVRGTGDDVLLHAGSVFHDQVLKVRWSGNANDWVKIGCYVGTGSARACRASDKRPEINGNFEPGCLRNARCPMNTSNAIPSNRWLGLVELRGNYIELRDLTVRDSAGIPVLVASTRNNPLKHHVIEDLTITHSAAFLVLFGDGAQFGVVRGIEGSFYNLCEMHAYEPCAKNGWPGGITIADSSPAHMLFEGNTVHSGWGEGFNCLRSSHVVVRGNKVGDLHSNAIYLDNCSNSIVENNVVWGGDPDNFWASNGGRAAVAVNTEDYPDLTVEDSVNNVIRNNLMASPGFCLRAAQWDAARQRGFKVGFQAYGNTCIGARRANVNIAKTVGVSNIDEIVIKNNVFYAPTVERSCDVQSDNFDIDFSHNLWQSNPGSRCSGQGDEYGNPQIVTSVAALASKGYRSPPEPRHFALKPSSPLLYSGTDLRHLRVLRQADYTFSQSGEAGCDLNDKALDVDFHCKSRQNPPTVGAIDRVNYPPNPPRLIGVSQ